MQPGVSLRYSIVYDAIHDTQPSADY